MDRFIEKGNKRLRYGITTGSCATIAAKAAMMKLVGYPKQNTMLIKAPIGWDIQTDVIYDNIDDNSVTCYVVKDAGDDPDVTNGIKIYAKVSINNEHNGISIFGGIGIGKVTKKGLSVGVGESAINPVPLKMIRDEIALLNSTGKGIDVEIFAPEGVEIAKRTFNSKLGIVDGISILGTSGIVEPMSEDALIDTIKLELSMKLSQGIKDFVFVFGNFGIDYIKTFDIDEQRMQKISNFIYDTMLNSKELGIKKILFVGHIGKMSKLSLGVKNTHSKYGDRRMEALVSIAKECGLNDNVQMKLFNCNTTDEAVEYLNGIGESEKMFKICANKCKEHLEKFCNDDIDIECIVFSNIYGKLGCTEGADRILMEMKR